MYFALRVAHYSYQHALDSPHVIIVFYLWLLSNGHEPKLLNREFKQSQQFKHQNKIKVKKTTMCWHDIYLSTYSIKSQIRNQSFEFSTRIATIKSKRTWPVIQQRGKNGKHKLISPNQSENAPKQGKSWEDWW